MGKRRRSKAKKVFPAKYNASRVNVGQRVDSFKTSAKTGVVPPGRGVDAAGDWPGRYIEVHHYRARGSNLGPPAWLDTMFPGVERESEERVLVQERRRELRTHVEARELNSILSILDATNDYVQTSYRHHHIKQFHFKILVDRPNWKRRLYVSRNEYFIVEEKPLGVLSRSIIYGSLERANNAHIREEILWAEVVTIDELMQQVSLPLPAAEPGEPQSPEVSSGSLFHPSATKPRPENSFSSPKQGYQGKYSKEMNASRTLNIIKEK